MINWNLVIEFVWIDWEIHHNNESLVKSLIESLFANLGDAVPYLVATKLGGI